MLIYNELWHPKESLFYYNVISQLKLNKSHDFVLISKLYDYNINYQDPWPKIKEEIIKKGKPVVMFLCDDEHYSIGDEYYVEGITTLIFKQYTYYYNEHPFIRPIPLGLVNAHNDFVNLPLKHRVYDYSFMGTYYDCREGFKRNLAQRDDKRVKAVEFYDGWDDMKDRLHLWNNYQQVLQSTKLSLCPCGPRSCECFRVIESARCGCIIISTEIIPHWYNLQSPYIKIDNWNDLSVIDQVLDKSEKELQELSDKSYRWYENYLSPKAIAQYVTQEVNSVI